MSEDAGDNAVQDRILLVDDDPTNLQILFETLSGRSYQLLTATSGQQALAIAAKAHPTLILLDIMMPELDGFETCERLMANPDTAESAVIFLSALDETKEKVRGLELGAVDYISKPFHAQEVIARVETHVKLHRLEQSLIRKNRELEEINRRMRLDLEAAARVQRSFLPESSPNTGGADFVWTYRPCEELGGDSLNVWAFDDRYVGVYVLDVSGHGASSALLAVNIARSLSTNGTGISLITQSTEDLEWGPAVSPAKVAAQLNKLYPMDNRNHLFFTLLYGVLDTQDGSFRFVCAGSPGPLLIRRDGTLEVCTSPGLPIGLVKDSQYEDATLQLEPGDRMYLYSDGLSEERNDAGEMFGRKRLGAVISENGSLTLGQSVEALIGEVENWRGNSHLRDDIAIVAVEKAPR